MPEYRKRAHTVCDSKYHLVWVTKDRDKVLRGEIALRARDLIREICTARDITILKGHVGRDHVHLFVSVPPSLSVSTMVQYIQGHSSRKLQQECTLLQKRYSGQHLWQREYFSVSSSTFTDKMLKAYIDQQDVPPKDDFWVSDDAQ